MSLWSLRIVFSIVINRFKGELKNSRNILPSFEIDFVELKIFNKISEGNSGIVYKGFWRGIKVAIKFLKNNFLNEDEIKDFLSNLTR